MAMIIFGHLWDLVFPINKALWSSSFVLVTAGWANILLALIYYVSDVKGLKFGSIFKYAGANAVGAILTGMGKDGALGLLNMRKNGARTIAQDEKSCIVFGMPKEAIEKNAAEKIVPLSGVAKAMIEMAGKVPPP